MKMEESVQHVVMNAIQEVCISISKYPPPLLLNNIICSMMRKRKRNFLLYVVVGMQCLVIFGTFRLYLVDGM